MINFLGALSGMVGAILLAFGNLLGVFALIPCLLLVVVNK